MKKLLPPPEGSRINLEHTFQIPKGPLLRALGTFAGALNGSSRSHFFKDPATVPWQISKAEEPFRAERRETRWVTDTPEQTSTSG